MKQFSLEEYLKNPSRKVVTRDGRKVERILCTDAVGLYPIVALVKLYDGITDRAVMYTKEGMYLDGQTNGKDLFFAPEKHEGWVNVYKVGADGCYNVGSVFDSREKALDSADSHSYISTIRIEWED